MKFYVFTTLVFFMASTNSSATASIDRITAVTNYLLNTSYPEVFDDKHYRIRIEHIFESDIDNDGHVEIVVHFTPHYRQTPTIRIYKVSSNVVQVVLEGLAPGPLVPVSGQFLDSYALGLAVDFSTGQKIEESARDALIRKALENFGNLVAYKSFFHADARRNGHVFVDMAHIDLPKGADNCSNFEFSLPSAVTSGRLEAHGQNFLAAVVGKEAWLIHIEAITEDGRIIKTVQRRALPSDFMEIASKPGERLQYRNNEGQIFPMFTSPK